MKKGLAIFLVSAIFLLMFIQYIPSSEGALPTLVISSPVNGATYHSNLIWLNYTVSGADTVTYTLQPALIPNAENISINATSSNIQIPVHMNMTNRLTVYASNNDGTVSQTVEFEVIKNDLVIWITTDHHVGRDPYPGVNEQACIDAIQDAENLYAWDYNVCLGDYGENENGQDFADMSNWSEIWYRNYSMRLQKGFVFTEIGNHEFNTTGDISYANEYIDRIHKFWVNSSAGYNTESMAYTVQIHNILFIFLPENYTNDPDYDRSFYSDMQQWFDNVVASNQDKNIIVFSHFPIYGTTDGGYQNSWSDNDYLRPIDCFNNTFANYNIDLWVHGHLHGSDKSNKWGVYISGSKKPTFIFNAGAIRNNGVWQPAEDWFLIFHNNSNVVTLRYHDVSHHEWGGTYCPSYYNITLSYPVDLSPVSSSSSDIQIVSIDNQTSSPAEIHTGTPTFNWTKITGATKYWLQIDDNNDFSSPEVNLSDINETNYPDEYTEKGAYIEFHLPDSEMLDYGTYWVRARAWSE